MPEQNTALCFSSFNTGMGEMNGKFIMGMLEHILMLIFVTLVTTYD